ncbi:MAG: helicase [Actinomycetota bacterium]
MAELRRDDRPATPDEHRVLARWSGWGAIPKIFDEQEPNFAELRQQLRGRLTDTEWAAARRTTLNAHYTPADVITHIWSAAEQLGLAGGRILEPGCGSGNFIGLAPERLDLQLVGVELDPITAGIAQALYPHAQIRAEGFEKSRFPAGHFDGAIGNVPFANVALTDRVHNRAGHSIHNHFVIKSLHLTRPGGIVMAITSRFTLDAQNPAARREIAELADFVGAVRLPSGAMQAAAGTRAVTDLVVLRRRGAHQPPGGDSFAKLADVHAVDGDLRINEYFAAHPERILGELRARLGQYSEADLDVVAGDAPVPDLLADQLKIIVDGARDRGLTWTPPPARPAAAPVDEQWDVAWTPDIKEGSIIARSDGGFSQKINGVALSFDPSPRKDQLGTLIGLRDAMNGLLRLEAAGADDPVCQEARQDLNRRYDAYVARYGPISRFDLVRTGRLDTHTAEPLMRARYPSMGGFRRDPDFRSLTALEVFDPERQTATKAAIFTRRVVDVRAPQLGADNAQDALAICLDQHGHPRLDVIADLLGVSVTQAREHLGQLVFDDPLSGDLQTAQRYLSGNVRTKLEQAQAAAKRDERWHPNVEALKAVMPEELLPGQIDARPGATWIAARDVEDFVADILESPGSSVDYIEPTATWDVDVPRWRRYSVTMTSEWGTSRADAVTLFQAALNQKPAQVYDENIDGTRTINPAETIAARDKQQQLSDRFSSWVWEDPQRAERLAAEYNRRFNSNVLPAYDGSHLSLPGLAANFVPHQHQRDAVWRIISEPSVLLAHDVGAGKTATMVMSAMEMRRLGLVNKPAIVIPNHMLDQFAREFKQLYPMASVLVADKKDSTKDGRKSFVARCATGDWDAVVMTESTFGRLPVSDQTRITYLQRSVDELRAALAEPKRQGSTRRTVKNLEKGVARQEERLKRLMNEAGKDDGLNWELLGLDYLMIDEAHMYKNLSFITQMPGVNGQGSQRAEDLHMKLQTLRDRSNSRVTTFATATPIANSIAEMHVMQTYLQPERLREAGVERFDAWAATFGRSVTALELAPDGGSYRLQSRFARFDNVPELLSMFRSVADVKSANDLKLQVPAVESGKPETVVVPRSDELADFVETLVERAEAVRSGAVPPEEDNMLKIAGDGRKAALDLRLVGRLPDPQGGKLAAAADRIAQMHHARSGWTYRNAEGLPAERPGTFQLVFCDLSTPKTTSWDAYNELRLQLVERGVPEQMIRFIHEAKDDQAKGQLFAACREGRVGVLIGSTEKMGVGTNVQARLSALHHLDCPWRPADLAQRDGRGVRQGNQNPEIAILRYVTEGSFDVFSWQTVERKAAFIHQIMAGSLDGREVDDIGETALSYAQIKAWASGNPLILEKAGVDNELAKLNRLREAHFTDQRSLKYRVSEATSEIGRAQQTIATIDMALPRRVDTSGDAFRMKLGQATFTKRSDAGDELLRTVRQQVGRARYGTVAGQAQVGHLGGFPLVVEAKPAYVAVSLAGAPVGFGYATDELSTASGSGTIVRLENQLRGLEGRRDELTARVQDLRKQKAAAEDRLGKPFDQQARVDTLTKRKAEIEAEMTPKQEAPPPGPSDTSGIKPASPAGAISAQAIPGTMTDRIHAATANGAPATAPSRPARSTPYLPSDPPNPGRRL